MAFYEKVKTQFLNIKNSAVIKKVNQIISSPWGIGALGLFTFLAFAFSLEIVFYTFVAIYTVYVGLFADDLSPIMPLFVLCYVTPSFRNNPGFGSDGVFYGKTATYLACIVSVAVAVLLLRIALDKDFGLRRLFTTKRTLLWGMPTFFQELGTNNIGKKPPEIFCSHLYSSHLYSCSILFSQHPPNGINLTLITLLGWG